MDKSKEIEKLIEDAHALEDTNRQEAISIYRRAIDDIVALDNIGPIAAAWRRARYPINRLSLLLEKEKEFGAALDEILRYEKYSDTLDIVSADKKSVASRKERILKRVSSIASGT